MTTTLSDLENAIVKAQRATSRARASTDAMAFLGVLNEVLSQPRKAIIDASENAKLLGIALDTTADALKVSTDMIYEMRVAAAEEKKVRNLQEAALRAALDWLSNAPISYANGVERYGVDEGALAGNAGHRMLLKQIMFALGIEEVSLEDWNKSQGKTE